MTKNELMEMAQRCGFDKNHFVQACTKHSSGAWVGVEDELQDFANAILERAAVECEKKNILYLTTSAYQGGDSDFEGAAAGARQCANGIRALKIDNQAQRG